MKSFKGNEAVRIKRGYIMQAVLSIALVVLLLFGTAYVNRVYKEQNIEIIRQSVKRTAAQCYSIEGIYPPDIEYLKENYHLTYDENKYFVFYDTFASNMMPVVEVYEKY